MGATFLQSVSSCTKVSHLNVATVCDRLTFKTPPLIITFIRSGGTPVNWYTASLKTVAGWSGSRGSSWTLPACLILTVRGAMGEVVEVEKRDEKWRLTRLRTRTRAQSRSRRDLDYKSPLWGRPSVRAGRGDDVVAVDVCGAPARVVRSACSAHAKTLRSLPRTTTSSSTSTYSLSPLCLKNSPQDDRIVRTQLGGARPGC